MGVPEWQWNDWRGWNRVLRNDGFLVGWSDVRGEALWGGGPRRNRVLAARL